MKGGCTIDYPPIKLFMNRLAKAFVRFLFRHVLNDTTNTFKAYPSGKQFLIIARKMAAT